MNKRKRLGLGRWLQCHLFKFHDWTSLIEENGGQVDMKLVEEYGIEKSFKMHAQLYCKHCGTESKLKP